MRRECAARGEPGRARGARRRTAGPTGDARGAGRVLWGPRSVVARLSPRSLLFPRNQLSPKLVGHFYALATPCRIKLFKISFSFPRARATRLSLRESEGGRGKAWPVAVRPVAAGAPQGPAPPLALGTVPGRFPGAKESEGRSRAEASTAPAPSRHPPGDGPLGPLLLDCFKTSSRGDHLTLSLRAWAAGCGFLKCVRRAAGPSALAAAARRGRASQRLSSACSARIRRAISVIAVISSDSSIPRRMSFLD